MLAFHKRFTSLILRGSNEESKGADAVKSVGLMVHRTHTKSTDSAISQGRLQARSND